MNIYLIIGNLISLIALIFTLKSSLSKDVWHIYFYQVLQCLTLSIASVFFNSYAGIITLFICAIRNYLAAKEKLTTKWLVIFVILLLTVGIAVNNRGLAGYIIIAANVIYTIGMYLCKKEISIKLNIIVDLSLWIIYEIIIIDIPSTIADIISLIATVVSIIKTQQSDK